MPHKSGAKSHSAKPGQPPKGVTARGKAAKKGVVEMPRPGVPGFGVRPMTIPRGGTPKQRGIPLSTGKAAPKAGTEMPPSAAAWFGVRHMAIPRGETPTKVNGGGRRQAAPPAGRGVRPTGAERYAAGTKAKRAAKGGQPIGPGYASPSRRTATIHHPQTRRGGRPRK